jgi:hypothetical protein
VQAPVRTTRSGKIVATTRANPFAPPRRVSGRLKDSVKVQRTAHGAKLTIYAPYAVMLEKSKYPYGFPHAFLRLAMVYLGIRGRNR